MSNPKKRITKRHRPRRNSTEKSRSGSLGFFQKLGRKNLLASLAIAVVTFIAFTPSFNNQLTNWDDPVYVTENPLIKSLSNENLQKIFVTPISSNYHPLTILSLAGNYRISGLNPLSFILTNLFFHLFNTILVFYLTFRLSKAKFPVAFIVALLFGIHPMHVESVTWISERKDVLYASFYLSGLLSYLSFRSNSKNFLYILSLLLFVLSALSKSAAVVFPLTLLLMDFLKNKKLVMRDVMQKLPFFAISILFGIIALRTQTELAIADLQTFTPLQKLMFASYGFMMYIVKMVAPFSQSAFYPYLFENGNMPVVIKLAPLIVAFALILSIWSIKQTKIILFGLLFFGINVVLVLQFITVGEAVMAERYTYISYIGLFFIIGYVFDFLVNIKNAKSNILKTTAFIVFSAYSSLLFYQTFERTKVWRDSKTLWSDVIEKFPNSAVIAYNQRGMYYKVEGKQDEALADFNKAIAIFPDYYRAYGNRGNIYLEQGFDKLALADYKKAVELKPSSSDSYSNLGIVYERQGKYEQALENYNKALEINPEHANTFRNRGIVFDNMGKYESAIQDYSRYLSFHPNSEVIYYARGVANFKLQLFMEALNDFDVAIKLNPNKGGYYHYRAYTHNQLNNKARALEDVNKAQSLGEIVENRFLDQLK